MKEYTNEITGGTGALIAVIAPLIHYCGIAIQILGGIGGLVLVAFSIHHKRLQVRREKMEIDRINRNEEEL